MRRVWSEVLIGRNAWRERRRRRMRARHLFVRHVVSISIRRMMSSSFPLDLRWDVCSSGIGRVPIDRVPSCLLRESL
jgi:hypothetical protein